MSPSDMMDDVVPPNDRVTTLERTVEDMKSQGDATQELLRELLQKLGPVLAQPSFCWCIYRLGKHRAQFLE